MRCVYFLIYALSSLIYIISQHNQLKMICWEKFIDFFSYIRLFSQIWQAVYFTLCIANDFIGTNEFHPKRPSTLRKFKDYVFASFAFPLALNVAISFWSIYAVDRELILPKSFDSFFPVYVLNWTGFTSDLILIYWLILNIFPICFFQMVESHYAHKCGTFHCNGTIRDIPPVSIPKSWHHQFDHFHARLRDLDSCH